MSTSLPRLDVLALDCQATAPDPAKGHLLEIGWSRVRASESPSVVEAHLLRLPEGAAIPKRVARVTGLRDEQLAAGDAPAAVWTFMVDAAGAIHPERCPTVIHFSRFEEPYLRWLHRQAEGAGDEFPFRIVCTHEIVRRLLPEIPRRGLRAVAGYFGHPVSEMRRCSHHVAATATVWRSVVELLETEAQVSTLEELEQWLSSTPTPPTRARAYPMSKKSRQHLPDRPGVYRMLGTSGDVLYVGKATSLKQRVTSYFRRSSRHAEHILEMLTQARELSFVVTGTALEAALEEADAIKRLSPPYNKALRARDQPLVFATRDLSHVADGPDAGHRMGPLPGGELWSAVPLLRRPDAALAVLLVPESYGPEAATFEAGLALFQLKLGNGSLLARGAELWRDEEPEDEEFRLQMQYDVGAERWSPERVAARLDEIVTRASHLVRRAHWLCLLSESTIAWDGVALVLEGGHVRARHEIDCASPIPLSAGHRTGFSERRKGFDGGTYDRLTVLTQEIRRLVDDGRAVSLHIGAETVLDEEKLRAILRWI